MTFWAFSTIALFKQKQLWVLVGQLLVKLGHMFIPASGHTEVTIPSCPYSKKFC